MIIDVCIKTHATFTCCILNRLETHVNKLRCHGIFTSYEVLKDEDELQPVSKDTYYYYDYYNHGKNSWSTMQSVANIPTYCGGVWVMALFKRERERGVWL